LIEGGPGFAKHLTLWLIAFRPTRSLTVLVSDPGSWSVPVKQGPEELRSTLEEVAPDAVARTARIRELLDTPETAYRLPGELAAIISSLDRDEQIVRMFTGAGTVAVTDKRILHAPFRMAGYRADTAAELQAGESVIELRASATADSL
jgi:hypothetical protein